jgi:hypothetical protein
MQATAPAAGGKKVLKSFAQGTSLFPTPIAGPGGQLTKSGAGGNTSVLTPIPKTGFLARLRYLVTGTLTVSHAWAAAYTVPIWRVINNYTLQNSLNYPYRSLAGDDIREWVRVTNPTGSNDPLINSLTYLAPSAAADATVPFSFCFEDPIGQNDGVNFSRYVLSAMTTSNDLTIQINWATDASLTANLGDGTSTFSAYTATCAVSAEYLTVPDPTEYQWPRRNLVQQVLGDPSFNQPAVGLNVVNLTPIQGPEFTGLGIQVVNAGGTVDTLALATSGISEIDIYVNGTIPLYQFTLADMIKRYEAEFQRVPANGYLYIDLGSDLSIPNVMSHTHRKVLSTSKYSQISVRVTLNNNFTAGAGARINLLKRTQQAYAQNQ